MTVTWFCPFTTLMAFVTLVQFVLVRSEFCCNLKPVDGAVQKISTVFVFARLIPKNGALAGGVIGVIITSSTQAASEYEMLVGASPLYWV